MKKIIGCLLAILLAIPTFTKADEGMWLPMLIKRLNEADMQKEGLKLTAEEIYSVNNASLKDAIISLGGFCTGEIVSADGLILTNHHCGFDAVATLSTVENDILTKGFFAMSRDQECCRQSFSRFFLITTHGKKAFGKNIIFYCAQCCYCIKSAMMIGKDQTIC